MNIHGYKKHYKGIVRMLRQEHNKPDDIKCQPKINRLERVKLACARKIRHMKVKN